MLELEEKNRCKWENYDFAGEILTSPADDTNRCPSFINSHCRWTESDNCVVSELSRINELQNRKACIQETSIVDAY